MNLKKIIFMHPQYSKFELHADDFKALPLTTPLAASI